MKKEALFLVLVFSCGEAPPQPALPAPKSATTAAPEAPRKPDSRCVELGEAYGKFCQREDLTPETKEAMCNADESKIVDSIKGGQDKAACERVLAGVNKAQALAREEKLLAVVRQKYCADGVKDCPIWLEALDKIEIAENRALLRTRLDEDGKSFALVFASVVCREDRDLATAIVRGRNDETLAVRLCAEAR